MNLFPVDNSSVLASPVMTLLAFDVDPDCEMPEDELKGDYIFTWNPTHVESKLQILEGVEKFVNTLNSNLLIDAISDAFASEFPGAEQPHETRFKIVESGGHRSDETLEVVLMKHDYRVTLFEA